MLGIDRLYGFDDDKVEILRQSKPWMNDPKYFKRVKISPSATIKMMTHGQSGVDKGISKGSKPIEVMGLLLGRPDTDDSHCIVISDAQPLPIEGFETRVIADDDAVLNYMIELGDSNETTRKERFCGWYHTHPFDVDVYSQCFLSSTDVSTQLQWQRSEDPHGNPWLAIVIDPLRSFAKGKPELSAFRVYPPEYTAPADETPDGTLVTDDQVRVERWGAIWNRYYQLETEYFMSTLAQSTLSLLKHKFLWQSTFSGASSQEDNKKDITEKISIVTESIKAYHSASSNSGVMSMHRSILSADPSTTTSALKRDDLSKSNQIATGVAMDACQCCIRENIKDLIFARNCNRK